MKKSKLALSIVAVALVGATAIGGTLAWFSDTANKENNLAMNSTGVDVEITEPGYETDGGDNGHTSLVPGDGVMKDPTINLAAGSVASYIRVPASSIKALVTKTGAATAEVFELLGATDGFNAAIGAGWTLVGDYYYYGTGADQATLTAVNAPASIKLLAEIDLNADSKSDTITIPTKFDQTYAGAKIKIDFKVEAVQADNFTSDTWGEAFPAIA